MILKELTKNRLLTIDYYQNGLLQTCKGYIHNLDLNEQTILLKDEQKRVFSLRLSGIKEVH